MANIHFITFGCAVNTSDTEQMMGTLECAGYTIVETVEDADVVIINSCTVKALAEKKCFKALRAVRALEKKVIVAGCVPQADKENLSKEFQADGVGIVGVRGAKHILLAVEKILLGEDVFLVGDFNNEIVVSDNVRRVNSAVGIVQISEGCVGECTYCKTRFARGRLKSFSKEEILLQVKSAVSEGVREIWLTSQDCGAYGLDIRTDLVELLDGIVGLDGDFMVRIGMMNPNHVLGFKERLISVIKENPDRIFAFLHIPVQAGSDRVLGLMKRKYNSTDFLELCAYFRAEMPMISLATDVICGFPTETEEEFKNSLDLMRKIKPDVINISRFWARKGTPAAEMGCQLHGRDTNQRSRQMRKLLEEVSLERNELWVGWKGRIIIDEKGNTRGMFIGRNSGYKPVVVCGEYDLGDVVDVWVKQGEIFCLNCFEIS